MSDIEKALARLRLTKEPSSTTDDGLAESAAAWAIRDTGPPPDSQLSSAGNIVPARQHDVPSEVYESSVQAANTASDEHDLDALSAKHAATTDVSGVLSAVSASKVAINNAENAKWPSNNPILELPLQALMSDGFLVPDSPKGRITEEYRRVKRPLLKNLRMETRPKNSNIIMVTSSVTGEGKTYTAINLAMSFALERDRTVLLIDGDVIKGSAGKVLGVDSGTMGLTDLLSGDFPDIGEAIMPTNVSSLSFLPSGTEHNIANELLSSESMSTCINELAEKYNDRIIIIDSPPILQTNEANIIIEYAGQIVFVVAEADTPQKTVTQALSHIDKEKYVGILINKSSSAGKTYAYGYDYGYE